VECGIRLAQLYAQTGSAQELLSFVGEAEEFFAPVGRNAEAADFFNETARFAERPELAAIRHDLRDRSLLGIAGKMKQQVKAQTASVDLAALAMLDGRLSVWPASIVSDADFAVKNALRRRKTRFVSPQF